MRLCVLSKVYENQGRFFVRLCVISKVCVIPISFLSLIIDLDVQREGEARPPSLPPFLPLPPLPAAAAAATSFFPSPQTEALFVCDVPPSLPPSFLYFLAC